MNRKSFLSLLIIGLLVTSNITNVYADPVPLLIHLQGQVVPTNPLVSSGQFGVLLNSGGSAYSYTLELPPGTNGLRPELSFSYTNQRPKSGQSFLGTGWDLSAMYMQRDTKNTFADLSDDVFVLVVNGAHHELVYNDSTDRYHTNPENFFSIQHINQSGNEKGTSWIIKTQEGTVYTLGSTNHSEQVSNLYDYVVRWSLDRAVDAFNNSIFYNYTENPYVNDNGTVYPDTILYNNDLQRKVRFIYESSDRADLNGYGLYQDGNRIKYSRRLAAVQVSEGNALITEYRIGYSPLDSFALSFMTNLTRYGADNSSLPPVRFSYTEAEPGWAGAPYQLPMGIDPEDGGERFGDFNRDGLVDMTRIRCADDDPNECLSFGNGDLRYKLYFNTGSSFVEMTSSWNYTHYFAISSDDPDFNLDTGTRIADINGDGFDDILYSNAQYSQAVWTNNGTNWNLNTSWHIPVNFSQGIYEEFEDMATQLVDINGDGFVDIVYGRQITSTKRTYLNNGTGWVRNETWDVPRYIVWENNLDDVDSQIRFSDFNGDGLVDIIATNPNQFWINTGNGWSEYGGYMIPPQFWDFFLNENGHLGDGSHRLVDVDGDGYTDIISSRQNYNPEKRSRLNTGREWVLNASWLAPDFFVDNDGTDEATRFVDINGDGAVDILDGQSISLNKAAGSYQLSTIQDEKGGITSIEYMPSTGLDNTGDDAISDLGFNLWVVANVTKSNNMSGAHALKAITHYNYSDGLYDYAEREFRGFGYVTETTSDKQVEHRFHQDDGKKYREYKTNLLDSNGTLFQTVEQTWNATDKGGYYEVSLIESSTSSYDGQAGTPRTSNISYHYDSFGNTILIHDKGEASTNTDDTYQYFNYLTNSTAWIVNKVKNSSLYASDGTTKLRETLYRYDGLAYGAAPTKGALTREEQWLSGGTNPVITHTYDSFGNLVNTTDANGHITQNIYGVRDTTHTFVDKVIDGAGNYVDYTYKLGTGQKLMEVDSNGFATNYTYDSLGRVTAEIQPYDMTSYPTKLYEYESNGIAPESIKTSIREIAGMNGTLDSYTFSDGFGNIIQTKKEGENGTQISSNTFYDLSGRVSKKVNPYSVSFSVNYSTPDPAIAFTNYTYDVLDRTIKIVNSDGTSNNATYVHWNVTFYDENGNRLDHTMNAQGKIIEIKEYNAGHVYKTRYFYNGNSKLIGIIDNANNTWNYTYDTLGRKVVGKDPDTGLSNYTYDAAGNLVKQRSGGGNLVSGDGYYRHYDSFGRLIILRNGNNASSPVLETYTYDGNGERIKTYNNATNTTTYTPFKEFTMIVNASGQYNYTYVYDDSDTLVARINPDGSTWYYHADHKGSTSVITNQSGDIVENTLYEPYGAVVSGGNTEDKLYEGKILDNPCQYQFGARYYNPCTALFTQPDSIIPDVYDPQQLNIYAFERGNPYSYVDKTGNTPESFNLHHLNLGISSTLTYRALKIWRSGIDTSSLSLIDYVGLKTYDQILGSQVDVIYGLTIETGGLPEDLRPKGAELAQAKREAVYGAVSIGLTIASGTGFGGRVTEIASLYDDASSFVFDKGLAQQSHDFYKYTSGQQSSNHNSNEGFGQRNLFDRVLNTFRGFFHR